MSTRRTNFSREKMGFSGISQALFERDCSSEQAVHVPIGQSAAPIANQALTKNPVTAALAILDAVIVAQPSRRRLPPPFGSNPLRPFDPRDVMHRTPPDEAARHAFGRRINDVDRFRPVEQ